MKNYRLRRNWRGKFVVQVEEIVNHCEDMGGSGYYDEYQTKHWRDAGTGDIFDLVCNGAKLDTVV